MECPVQAQLERGFFRPALLPLRSVILEERIIGAPAVLQRRVDQFSRELLCRAPSSDIFEREHEGERICPRVRKKRPGLLWQISNRYTLQVHLVV